LVPGGSGGEELIKHVSPVLLGSWTSSQLAVRLLNTPATSEFLEKKRIKPG